MIEECRGVKNWFSCLNCKFLSTHICPLEGDDAIDRISNRIKMLENPEYDGFKKIYSSQ